MESNYTQQQFSIRDILDENKFVIPQFQRNVVWKKPRRKDFIANIRNGDPFGVILIRMYNDKFELIDGLQRISTIKNYLNNPFDYLSQEDVNENLVKELVIKALEFKKIPTTEEYLKKRVPETQKQIFNCLKGNLKNWQAMTSLRNNGFPDDDEISGLIDKIYTRFNNDISIDNMIIFAINYTGPEENIPNVFYNLNTGGVSLSKYETYAALWSKPLFKLNDEEIITQVEEKYTTLQEKSDLEVNFSLDLLREEGISLFEYCYALSGILRSESRGFDIIVGSNSKSTDPLGFELLSLVLGQGVNKADMLYKILSERSPEFLIKLKKLLIDSLLQIATILKDVVVGLGDQELCSDSTYMFYHIMISYIRENYEINVESETIEEKKAHLKFSDLKKYLPLHYINDVLCEYWKTNRQVSDLTRELNNNESRTKYWYNINTVKWQDTLRYFMEQQAYSYKTIPYKNKIFIDFMMKLKLKEEPRYRYYFKKQTLADEYYTLDFEHIVPKKIIERAINDLTNAKQSTYPISSLGNLCYLSSKDNRSKKNKTIYEFQNDRPSFTTEKEYLDFIQYPSEEDLRFIKYKNIEFREEYARFLKERTNRIEKEFIRLIQIYY